MPSGKTHDRITLWSLAPLVALSYTLTREGELTLLVAGGFLFSGLMFGPDLDIYSRQFQRWGPLRWIWLPYQKCFRHRSFFSHGLVVGTLVRLGYLATIILLSALPLVAIAQLCFGLAWNWQTFVISVSRAIVKEYPQEAIALCLGLELGAMSHCLSDWIGLAYKKGNTVRKSRRKPRKGP